MHWCRARLWYYAQPALSVLQCILLRHRHYFIHTEPPVYHAAAYASPVRPHHRTVHIPDSLTCTHVFVRHDAIRKLLQHPYDGPYKILKRTPKRYTLDIQGRSTTVSLDRLKPAHLEPPQSSASATPPSNIQPSAELSTTSPASPPRVTRSGRHVRWPDHFHY